MTKKYEWAVVIGRFQPFHNAHLETLVYAGQIAEQVLVVLGSCNKARDTKNPWSAEERIEMIRASVPANVDVCFITARDYLYNDNLWLAEVQQKVNECIGDNQTTVLVGHKKDASSYYLKLFPQWEFVDTQGKLKSNTDATTVRNLYFTCDAAYTALVPANVASFLKRFQHAGDSNITLSEQFKNLHDEFHHLKAYRESWMGAPFPPIFVTTDCVVIKSGHVLVVKRKGNPGRGLFALPGGFLNQNELTVDGAIRELKEETGIKVHPQELKDAICDRAVFDHPDRSLRGRTITHGFCINLKHGDLPQVKGMDDAAKAWWMPLRDVLANEDKFFEDHFHVITYFVNKF